ncbi:nucleotidyltransferase substrate binding protein [Fusibacter bizertensis]
MSEIRWKQRFSNYRKALRQLKEATDLMSQRELSNLEKQGVIQAFEFTHELSWNVMKDFLVASGNTEIYGSRDAIRRAFKYDLIVDGEVWMDMIKSRNLTSHTYDEHTIDQIVELVSRKYIHAFIDLELKFIDLEKMV